MKKQIKELIFHPLFTGSAIMIIGSNSVSALSYLYHLILGRLLGPVSYGELASLISLIGILGILPGSINLVIVKYISSAKNDKEIYSLINWLKLKLLKISLLFFIVILLASQIISSFLHIDKIIYLVFIALSFLFSLQALFNRAVLQGLLKFKELIFSVLAENITKLIVSVILVYIGWNVGGAMVAFLVATVVGWYMTIFYLRYNKKSNPSSPKNIKSMIQFSILVFIQSISLTSLYSSDVILVKHFFSSYDAGIYAAISTLGKIIFFGAGPISAVMFPLVSQRQSRGEDYKKIFAVSFISASILASGVLILYWLFPEFAIGLLYGQSYLSGTSLLVWYGIFIALFTLSVLLVNYGLSVTKTKIVFFSLAAALLQIILIWFFHKSLQEVINVSIFVTALLLGCLFIYFSYDRGSRNRDKIDFSNSPSI